MKTLAQRADAMRSRLRLRAWEFRQLGGTKGTWYRLRRMLARAREAHAIDEEDMRELLAEGFSREPAGDELAPPRSYVFVPEARAERIASRRALRVSLSAELLAAQDVALVAFDET